MHKEEVAKYFKALSEETRVKIIKVLYNNNKISIRNLLNMLNCTYLNLSIHLSILLESNLIIEEKENNEIFYLCNKELIDELMSFFSKPCQCCI